MKRMDRYVKGMLVGAGVPLDHLEKGYREYPWSVILFIIGENWKGIKGDSREEINELLNAIDTVLSRHLPAELDKTNFKGRD